MDYFKRYLRVSPFSHALWRTHEARTVANIELKKPILDLGCGFGEFAGVFFESSLEMGIDNSKDDLEAAKLTKKYKKLVLEDVRNMSFKNESFSTVLSISVIEHITRTKDVLKEVYRVLKKDGTFVFTTPRKNFTRFLFYSKLLRVFKLEGLARLYEKKINRVFKHYSLYTEEQWTKMLKDQGFEVEKIEPNICESTVLFWDLGLIFALPTFLAKKIFRKRFLFSPSWRVELLYKLFLPLAQSSRGRPCNLLIVARKPK